MPRQQEVVAPQEPRKPPRRKQERIEIRVDPELADRARERAKHHGWSLSSVLRALLSKFADEGGLDPDEVGEHAERAKKPKNK